MAAHQQQEGESRPASLSCEEAQSREIKRVRQDNLDESNAMKFRHQVAQQVGIKTEFLLSKLNVKLIH